MKGKIFISFICALIFLVVTFAFLYNSAKEDKTKGHETAIQAAKEHGFASIDEVNTFYNRNVYYIIQGKNKKGEKIIGWMKKRNTDKILIKKAKEGLSKDDVLQLIQNIDNSKPKKIKKIMLGYDDTDSKKWDIPVWEVQYIDQQNRYTYFIVSFTDDRVYKMYSIKQ
ncbi:cell wall elongation regulator TseB-like domain-containing protein [Aeribacillus sp. FSL M8-0235]|uniref:cell wall elongation regulator TseB-like domain-containing protein n=1 Tax=Aeribacillus sp. FSL M8-0235 TaxID=2954576 RepID=UPI0030F558D5